MDRVTRQCPQTTTFLEERAEAVSNRGPSAYQPYNALPLGQTGSIVQELCESRGGRPGLSVPNEPSGFRGRKELLKPCFGIGHNLSLICQLTSEDIKHHFIHPNRLAARRRKLSGKRDAESERRGG